MLYVIEYVEKNSMTALNDLWMKGRELVLWPCTLTVHTGGLLKGGSLCWLIARLTG